MTGRRGPRTNAPGRHPSAPEQYRPRGEIDLLREPLEPFGLGRNDNRIWSTIKPLFVALARRYNFRNDKGAIPRPGQVKQSLSRVEKAHEGLKKAAEALIEAIGALDDVALEWMLAYDDPTPLFARGRAETDPPSVASDDFKRLRDRVFESEFKDYDRLADERFREFASSSEAAHKEFDQAGRDLFAARSEFDDLNRQYAQNLASGERERIDQQMSESLRLLEQKERDFRMATLRVGAFLSPSPHFFRDGLRERVGTDLNKALRRVPPVGALAGQARDRFAAVSPEDKGGFAPLFLGKHPKYRMAEECCEILVYAFGRSVVDQIQGGKEGTFANLLRAVHEFATGEEPSGEEFREILDNKIGDLRAHLSRL